MAGRSVGVGEGRVSMIAVGDTVGFTDRYPGEKRLITKLTTTTIPKRENSRELRDGFLRAEVFLLISAIIARGNHLLVSAIRLGR